MADVDFELRQIYNDNLPANAGDIKDMGLIPGSGRTHFSILAWEIPRTQEPGRLQSMESQSPA